MGRHRIEPQTSSPESTAPALDARGGPRFVSSEQGDDASALEQLGTVLDVDMDCARMLDGWVELEALEAGGAGWEPDIDEADTPARTRNPWIRCGAIDRLVWSSNGLEVREVAP